MSSLLDYKITTLRCEEGEDGVENTSLLSYKNASNFDKHIRFEEEGHRYWIKGIEKDIISSTTLIHLYFPHFESEKIIKRIVRSRRCREDPDYKYFNMTATEISDMWAANGKQASDLGTILHAMIEHNLEGKVIKNDSLEYGYYENFMLEHQHLTPYRTEWMVCAEELRITGSIDAVFENPDGTLSIVDWKRSKGVDKKAFRKSDTAYYPFKHMPDCNFSKYSLQLNLYRVIIETYYDKKVKDMFLVVLHPNQKNYQKIMVPRLEREGLMLLESRKQSLLKMGYTITRTFCDLPSNIKQPTLVQSLEPKMDQTNVQTLEVHRSRPDTKPGLTVDCLI